MTTKQVLSLASTFLGKEDLLSCPYFTEVNEEISSDDQKELDFLLRCLNLIVSEISTEYLPIYKQKQIRFVNNTFSLSEVDDDVFQIISIKDKYNQNVRFKIINNQIIADAEDVCLTYTAFASECTLNGDVDEFFDTIPPRVLAYGTAMEYSFISSLFDDAEIWESRYKNSLLSLSRKKHEIVIPKRRWL